MVGFVIYSTIFATKSKILRNLHSVYDFGCKELEIQTSCVHSPCTYRFLLVLVTLRLHTNMGFLYYSAHTQKRAHPSFSNISTSLLNRKKSQAKNGISTELTFLEILQGLIFFFSFSFDSKADAS